MRSSLLLFGVLAACSETSAVLPQDAATPELPTVTFALQKLYLGETTRDGVQSNTAWKSFGYNLDGKSTISTSPDVCKRPPAAPSSNQVDGNGGVDNAFGAVVLPILESALGVDAPSAMASAAYQAGKRTLQISIQGLSDDPRQSSTQGIRGGVFPSLAYQGDSPVEVPFPGAGPTTDWPVRVEGLADGATIAGGPKLAFGQAYAANGSFVGRRGSLSLTVDFAGGELTLILHQAIVTFAHTAPGDATNGVLAGVLDPEELALAVKGVAAPLCGTQFDAVAAQMRQAVDIMADESNVPGATCNAISVGFGFEATRIANPTKIAKEPVPARPDPCP